MWDGSATLLSKIICARTDTSHRILTHIKAHYCLATNVYIHLYSYTQIYTTTTLYIEKQHHKVLCVL